jgi:hypothetical protein
MIIGILTDPEIGGTFLSWSLHYLSGDKEYFCARQNKMLPVPINPLNKNNAHGFIANQPSSLNEFNAMINDMYDTSLKENHTIYFHNYRNKENPALQTNEDTTTAIKKLQELTNKIVVVTTSSNHKLYFSKFEERDLYKKFNSDTEFNKDFTEQHEDFINTFFLKSKKHWEKLGLDNTWDQREFLALNIRPYNVSNILDIINLTYPHYLLDSFDLYNQFDKTILSVFDYLDLTIDKPKWQHWLYIYKQWQHIHSDRVLFVEYFDVIVKSIINNYYLDLKRFNLDILREAVIQHELIYKHGLTIKGWELEKFPNNAQDLYKLLEPNIYHQVEDIYNCLERK